MFLANNLILTLYAFTVLVGTMYPLLLEAFAGRQVSVGRPFFDRVTLPVAFALLLAMGVGPVTPYRVARVAVVWRRIVSPLQVGLAAALGAALVGVRSIPVVVVVALGVFVIAVLVHHFAAQVRTLVGRGASPFVAMGRVLRREPGYWGGQISHVGVALVAIAIATTTALSIRAEVEVTRGGVARVGEYCVGYLGPFNRIEPNRAVDGVEMVLFRDDCSTEIARMFPRVNRYAGSSQPVATPDVHTGLVDDVYLSLNGSQGDRVFLDVLIFPFMWLLWVGECHSRTRWFLVVPGWPGPEHARSVTATRACLGMSRGSVINAGVLVGLLVALLIVLWPDPPPAATDAERTVAIADQLRCPYCNGESIADAPSAIARDLQDFIEEEVARGKTDDEIIDFFIATYGEQVHLDPPLLGWGVWLWLLPLLALGFRVGVLAANRLRGSRDAAPTDAGAIEEQLTSVRQDLDDLELQVASGEIAASDADRLRIAYETEVALLEDLEPVQLPAVPRNRVLGGGLVLVLGAMAMTVGVIAVADDRAPDELITGGGPGNSLADVTNAELEEVVAENPDIVGMRLALAARYFEAAEFSDALRHYLHILGSRQHPEALANVGWMTFLSGDAETGLALVERAIDVDPEHLQAYWFVANIRFHAYDDAAGAIDPLERLLAGSGVPDDVRDEARRLLEQARAAA